jgi:hypothetical protein
MLINKKKVKMRIEKKKRREGHTWRIEGEKERKERKRGTFFFAEEEERRRKRNAHLLWNYGFWYFNLGFFLQMDN